QIQGEKLDAYSKCRGTKAAKLSMLDAMKKDFDSRFKELIEQDRMSLRLAYSDMTVFEVESWKNEVKAAFPGFDDIQASPLSLSVGCHIGPGSLAIACAKITK
ncbi:MAG: DegV family protein, partial [Clostridia bacterium]|nr:DegV family protein [Clostridia bacterium]